MSLFPDIAADDLLLARARSSDRSAWQELYSRYSGAVYTLIRRMVGRPAVAEELMQDAFMELFRSLPDYQGTGSFGGWVRSIAVSKALMYVRSPLHRWSTERIDECALDASAGHAWPSADSRLLELERALAALPAQTRSIVWLHDVEGMTHAEIAAHYGASPSFSKSQLARGHRQLRASIEHGESEGAVTCDSAATH